MWNKRALIHSIKDGKSVETLKADSLLQHLNDHWLDTPHEIFACSPDKCSRQNLVDKSDKIAMMAEGGEYTIVYTPGAAFIAAYGAYIALAISIASAVYAFVVAGNAPTVDVQDLGSSANNSLSARVNRERPLKRIEDIAGELRSWPALIQLPYRKFGADQKEVEFTLMCYGVGKYAVTDAKESDTPIDAIADSGAVVFGPGKMPGLNTPDYTFGTGFSEPVKIISRSRNVKGGINLPTEDDLTLSIPTGESRADGNPGVYPGATTITKLTGEWFFTDYLDVGDIFDLQFVYEISEPFPGIFVDLDLDGQYIVDVVSPTLLVLKAPDGQPPNTVNSNWDNVDAGIDDKSLNQKKATISPDDPVAKTFLGPYFLPRPDRNAFFVNFAANGLVKDNGGSVSVDLVTQYAEADSSGNQIGAWSADIADTISGKTRDRIGITTEVTTSFTGPCLVRCRRVTDRISGSQIQDVTIDALYSESPLGVSDFGGVTIVQTRSVANSQATQPSERKFNSLIQRILPNINGDGTIGPELPTKRFIDYFYYAATAESIGRRQASEVNALELSNQYSAIVSYFGDTKAGEFSYTFDSDQTSFQAIAYIICEPVFSIPVRKNGIIYTKFERPGDAKTIFCHRNKIPGSQSITRTFNSEGLKDGIEFQYVDPDTDETKTITLPTDNSATRPEKVESRGVRTFEQAYWLAHRKYNKQLFSRIVVNDTLTAEGALLGEIDIVKITNNTKVLASDGEVLRADGLLLTLSQPVTFDPSDTHSIALRKRNGEIQIIPCTNPNTSNISINVTLAYAPDEAIYTGVDEIRTLFSFSPDARATADKYIIATVNRDDAQQIPITAINYAEEYYRNDTDTPSI